MRLPSAFLGTRARIFTHEPAQTGGSVESRIRLILGSNPCPSHAQGTVEFSLCRSDLQCLPTVFKCDQETLGRIKINLSQSPRWIEI